MKDFIFTRNDTDTRVTFRTDCIGDNQNFTIMEIRGLDPLDLSNSIEEKALAAAFKQLPTNLATFIEFAEDNGLQLVSNDGDTKTIIVDFEDSDSDVDIS